jgi:iron complex outermembrane receptor protein
MKEYVRIDFSSRYSLTDALAVTTRVENLLDEDIEEGLGYEEPGVYAIVGVDYSL